MSTFTKHDNGKPRLDLIAPEFVNGLGRVLAFGAAKYDDRNWEKGANWGRYFAAAQRHLWAWIEGEDIDPESDIHHLLHAACSIMFLHIYQVRNLGMDDRPDTLLKQLQETTRLLDDTGQAGKLRSRKNPPDIRGDEKHSASCPCAECLWLRSCDT